MSTVKINNKKYEIPELTFRHSKLLEQYGVSVKNLVSTNHLFTIASAFVAIVVNCDTDQADYLIEQHFLGGGDLVEIYNAYIKALSDSHFFRKLLGVEEETKTEEIAEIQKTEEN